jgi:hypothetical protein
MIFFCYCYDVAALLTVQALKSMLTLRFEFPWAHTMDIVVSCVSLYISLG